MIKEAGFNSQQVTNFFLFFTGSQTSNRVHQSSWPMGTIDCLWDEVAREWSWLLTSILYQSWEHTETGVHKSQVPNHPSNWIFYGKKGKAVLLQAWSDPGGSRELRFPDFMSMAQDGGKVVSLTHWPPLPQEMFLVLISVRGWVNPRTTARSEGFYVNEKFQWHQLGSN